MKILDSGIVLRKEDNGRYTVIQGHERVVARKRIGIKKSNVKIMDKDGKMSDAIIDMGDITL